MYDIIGDVHGHAGLLKKLLIKMGYTKSNGCFSHPERKAVFVGDFINRGPEIRKTIRMIRAMVEQGCAFAILGNHEINAIIYNLKDEQGRLLVNKPNKYFLSLFKTINEYDPGSSEWKEDVKWMRTLPLFLDLGDIRVVHACWSNEAIEIVNALYTDGKIKKKVFRKIYKKGNSPISKAVWTITKGVNLKMPRDLKILNNKGVSPRSIRIRWWIQPEGQTFGQSCFDSKYELPNYTIPQEILPTTFPYPDNAPLVFFGHYCRGRGPNIIRHNICCVDSCVTGTKTLCAYRWNGEKELTMNNLVHYREHENISNN